MKIFLVIILKDNFNYIDSIWKKRENAEKRIDGLKDLEKDSIFIREERISDWLPKK